MGNCHSVTQIKPTVHQNGAVIQVKSGEEKRFEKLYKTIKDKDNTSLSRPEIEIHCPNINESANKYKAPSKNLYLVLASGSKYGYGEGLREIYKKCASLLEDGLFYITDEYSEYIEKFEIKKGKFFNKIVVPENGDLIQYYEENFPEEKEITFQLIKKEAMNLAGYLEYESADTLKRALKLANKALKINPDDLELLTLKGNILTHSKKYDQAIKILEKTRIKYEKVYRKPEEQNCLEGRSKEVRHMYYSLAYAYLNLKQFKKAIPICEIADKIYPTWHDDSPKEYLGFAYLNLKEYQKALNIFDKIIRSNPKRNFLAFAFYNKACALTGLGRLDEASAYMTAAFSLDPNKFPKAFKEDKDIQELLNFKNLKKIMGPLHGLISGQE